jgi:hypothetical protein
MIGLKQYKYRFLISCMLLLQNFQQLVINFQQSGAIRLLRRSHLARQLSVTGLIIVLLVTWSLAGMPGWPKKGSPLYVAASSTSAGPRGATASGDCTDDATVGTVSWTSPGNAFSTNATNATASVNGTITHYIKCQNFGFTTSMIPTGSIITGFIVSVLRKSSAITNGGSADSSVRVVKGGAIGATNRATATTYTTSLVSEDHGSSSDLWGNTWTVSDVTDSTFGAAFAATKASATGSAHTISVDSILITVYFIPPPPTLTQRHYIFQQDNGADVNSNSNNSTADTALTGVRKGERLNVRFQTDNTGSGDFTNGQYELFYDHNDGIWSKVQNGVATNGGGSGCTTSQYTCSSVDTSNNYGKYNSSAVDNQGRLWTSYYDVTNHDLRVARYVGSGGSGCGSSSWSCVTVDSTGDVGSYSSIAISPAGQVWVAYTDVTNGTLKIAQNVDSGGSGCAVSTWSCAAIFTSTGVVKVIAYTSLAISSDGTPWVAFDDASNSADLVVAAYVGSGGTGCTGTTWTCTSIDKNGTVIFKYVSMKINFDGVAWISYYDATNLNLQVAKYVVSGGTGCGISSAWTCSTVDSTGDVGSYSSLSLDPSGNPWISYYDSTPNLDLKVAKYVASSGTGCALSAWTCTTIDSTNDVGQHTNIAADATGTMWISYYDNTNGYLRLAQYVGSGGSGCASSAWGCSNLDTSANVGQFTSMAFAPNGNAWLSYYDATNSSLKVAKYLRASEIVPGYGLSGLNGDALTSAAAGTCTGGTTFSNGVWDQGVNISQQLTVAASKCTEVSFMIDTSQATAGSTYRFALRDMTNLRGLDAYSVFPTLTISNSDLIHISKDNVSSYAACTGTNWGCQIAEKVAVVGGAWAQITTNANGTPTFGVYSSGVTALIVAQYVGSGGNCTSSTSWNCTTVDSSANVGTNVGINTAPDGSVWVSYRNATAGSLKIATNSAKSGLAACTAAGWYCTTVDSTAADLGYETSVTFDPSGNPWIAYDDTTNTSVKVANFVGLGGNCTSTAFNCVTVDTIGTNGLDGDYPSLAFDSYGNAWLSYNDGTNTQLKLATDSGRFGSACTSTKWTCGVVDNTGTDGQYTSIAIDATNKIWISYSDSLNHRVRMAEYVTSGGNCTSAAFNCYDLDPGNASGEDVSLVISPNGAPAASFYSTGNILRYTKYVGSSGSGCTSTAWTCVTVDSSVDAGARMLNRSLVFDASGLAHLLYYDTTNSQFKVAKQLLPDYSQSLRYKLDNLGYTSAGTSDLTYDPMAATTNVPIYNFDIVEPANTINVAPTWIGKSSIAASTNNLKFEVYRYGSTNAWQTLATNTTCSANTTCTITPTAVSTNLSEYYQTYGSKYLLHLRVYAVAGSSKTLSTDYINQAQGPTQMAFTNAARTVTSQYCSGAANSFTLELRDNSNVATNASGNDTIQLSSSSTSTQYYSDSNCTTPLPSNSLSFTSADSSKTFYVLDGVVSTPTWTLTASLTSGVDTISNGAQTYTVTADTATNRIKSGTKITGGSRL